MPKLQKGHRFILCVIDEVTNYFITVHIYQSKPEEIRKALIEIIISKYCVPDYIIMDLYSAFMSTLMNYLFKKFGITIKTIAPYNCQSLQAEHGIKSLSNILTKHLTDHGRMWPKYLPVATLAYNTFNSPSFGNFSPYKLVFGRNPKLLLDVETDPDIKVSGTYKDYDTLLNKRQYLHKVIQEFRLKRLDLINKDGDFFQYNRDLVYIISPLTSQLRTALRKFAIKYIGPLVVYKIIDLHNYLLMTLDGKLLRGLFEHERLKPAVIRTNLGKCN